LTEPSTYENVFTTLYQQHSGKLYSAIIRYVKSEEVAEDLVQDLFVKLWNNRVLFTDPSFQAGYLYTAAKNAALDYLKKEAVHIKAVEALSRAKSATRNTSQERIEGKEYQQVLLEAVTLLSPQRQLAYALSQEEELSYQDIADKMQISRATVKRHLEIARRFVRKYMIRQFPDIIKLAVSFISGSLFSAVVVVSLEWFLFILVVLWPTPVLQPPA
jgi:RNA polymerase sigma-70 factor (family 1)